MPSQAKSSWAVTRYFGAAKDLPGVRELFETEIIPDAPRKTRTGWAVLLRIRMHESLPAMLVCINQLLRVQKTGRLQHQHRIRFAVDTETDVSLAAPVACSVTLKCLLQEAAISPYPTGLLWLAG